MKSFKTQLDESILEESLDADIAKVKKKLITQWKRKGGVENFGDKEIRKLEDAAGWPTPKEIFGIT